MNTSGPGGAWTSEQAWNRNNGIGSGGGISTQYAIPTWQQGLSMVANHGSTTMRNVPDVALTADYVYVRSDGIDQSVGGTSAAAPLWAGFTSLINQRAVANGRSPVGFVNPAIYAISQGASYGTGFHDITVGNNTNTTCGSAMFPVVANYDLATSLGSPAVGLIDVLAGPFGSAPNQSTHRFRFERRSWRAVHGDVAELDLDQCWDEFVDLVAGEHFTLAECLLYRRHADAGRSRRHGDRESQFRGQQLGGRSL